MSKPKLSYFDAPVSRGEECRLALHAANVDFEDNGPADHGAYFRFKFGDLATDASRTFQIFYGAAASESAALAAIAAGSKSR